jgi:hypothetical protein
MPKKSQLHTMETIAVLGVFTILIVLGVFFYFKVFKSDSVQENEEKMQMTAVEIAQRASTMPELQCSENNIVKDNCVDRIKLGYANSIINTQYKTDYFNYFGYSVIKIDRIYPEPLILWDKTTDTASWMIYSNPLGDEEYKQKSVTKIPISIFYPNEDMNAFGVMTVEVYSK